MPNMEMDNMFALELMDHIGCWTVHDNYIQIEDAKSEGWLQLAQKPCTRQYRVRSDDGTVVAEGWMP